MDYIRYTFADAKKLKWWASAPEALLDRFLSLVRPGLTRNAMSQWINHRRGISSGLAGDIERATRVIAEDTPDVMIITRGDLCESCSKCEYFIAGSKNEAQNT